MPRIGKAGNASGAERTMRYRDRLRAAGRPGASAVDIAVAAAAAGYGGETAANSGMDVPVLKRLLRDAMDQMVAAGSDRKEARRKLIRRIGRFSMTVPGARTSPSGPGGRHVETHPRGVRPPIAP